MTEIPALENTEDTKACKVCAEPIKKAARVCIHCNNYQDWHANIGFSNTVLALLVALTTTLTAAIPVIREAFTPRNSHIYFSFQGSREKSISVLFTNAGTRPGSISHDIWLELPAPLNAQIPLTFADVVNSSAFLIEPNKSVLLQLTFDRFDSSRNQGQFFTSSQAEAIPQDAVCDLLISGTDFLAESKAKMLQIPCKELIFFILDVAHQKVAAPSAPQPPAATTPPASTRQ